MSEKKSHTSSNILVSVIIPVYNAELYINKTINSVLLQTYGNIEIICIDNGSTDNSISILEELTDQHTNLHLYHELKKGASYARTTGLKFAKGSYIQFLDADDIILPKKIELQLNHLLAGDFDMVVSDRSIYDLTLSKQINHLKFSEIIDAPLETAISTVISSGNPLYTKSIVEKVGGYTPDLNICQDWDFHIKLVKADAKIGYLPGDLFHSRQVTNSLSSDWLKVSEVFADLLYKYKHFILEKQVINNHNVQLKILQTYLQLLIHNFSNSKCEFWFKELNYWRSKEKNILNHLKFIDKTMIRLIGLKNYIRLKRALLS